MNELANQKYVYQKINGWKIFHLSAGMEDIIDMESELSKKFQQIGKRLEESANENGTLVKIQELLKANIQRSFLENRLEESANENGTLVKIQELLKANIQRNFLENSSIIFTQADFLFCLVEV